MKILTSRSVLTEVRLNEFGLFNTKQTNRTPEDLLRDNSVDLHIQRTKLTDQTFLS